ncbi:MAG: chorismate dehydratase [Sphingobacteriales bacterium]|jgi:chorismate dehydratase
MSYKIALVSYLNTRPFVHGLENYQFSKKPKLSLDIPSICAKRFSEGFADIALVPVGALNKLNADYKIFGKHCLGANGPVKSVFLFSQVPLNQVKRVFLDPDSETSNLLVQVLSKDHWNVQLKFVKPDGDITMDKTDAVVAIGDKTFSMHEKFSCSFDLSEEWYHFTGMPFVFAVWVAKKAVSTDFEEEFSEALELGLEQKHELLDPSDLYLHSSLSRKEYLEECMQYGFGEVQKKAMEKFLKLIP